MQVSTRTPPALLKPKTNSWDWNPRARFVKACRKFHKVSLFSSPIPKNGIFCTNLSKCVTHSTKPKATSEGLRRFWAPGGVCIGSADLRCLTRRSAGGTRSTRQPAPKQNHTAEQDHITWSSLTTSHRILTKLRLYGILIASYLIGHSHLIFIDVSRQPSKCFA